MAQNPVAHTHTPFDASWHLRAELKRVLDALTRYLASQRQRGRTAAGDVVRGLVIEDGEVEGLLADLAASLTSDTSGGAPAPSKVDEIAQRADSAADQGAFLPLRHVQKVFDLAPEEYFSVLLALAVETDSRFGRVIAYLNDHVGRTRPTIGLALALASLETGR